MNEEKPTQIKLKPEYRAKLSSLAHAEHRSLANMVEVLIDTASYISEPAIVLKGLKQPSTERSDPKPKEAGKK